MGRVVNLEAIEDRAAVDIGGLVRKLIRAKAMPKELAPNYLETYPPSAETPQQHTYFLALDERKEIGIAVVRWSRQWSCRLPAFGIYPGCRGKGYGRAFATALFEEINKRGYEEVTGLPVPRSKETTSLYKLIGAEGYVQGIGLDETYSVELGTVPEVLARLKATAK